MEVYVLLGHIDYEDTLLLGVYHTKEDAEFHKEVYINKQGMFAFDSYSIESRVIGARAFGEYDGKAAEAGEAGEAGEAMEAV